MVRLTVNDAYRRSIRYDSYDALQDHQEAIQHEQDGGTGPFSAPYDNSGILKRQQIFEERQGCGRRQLLGNLSRKSHGYR